MRAQQVVTEPDINYLEKTTLDDREMKPWYLLLCGLNGTFEQLQQLPELNLPPNHYRMN
jgi:hypothetical protein